MRTYLDAAMCFFWITTYTLVLIGSIKYKYLLISPITQAIIAPFEFAVVGSFIRDGVSINYAFIAYVYWSMIEIVILLVALKGKSIPSKYKGPYIICFFIMVCVMYYLVAIKRWIFFFSYFNTFVGEIFWLAYVFKKDYPIKPIALAIFLAKFVGDTIAVPIYLGTGIWIISLICLLLPVLDSVFIFVYIERGQQVSVQFQHRRRK